MISKHRKISFSSKVYYLMDLPVLNQTWDKSEDQVHNRVRIPGFKWKKINCNRPNRAFYTDVDQVKSSQAIYHSLAQNNPLTVL